jgi:hypothetical protein
LAISAPTIKVIYRNIEIILAGLRILAVVTGNLAANTIPEIKGSPSRINTTLAISKKSILIGIFRADAASWYFTYNPPQIAKFRGVRKVAARVAKAVKLTDNATLAFASDEIKFEIFPPGQAAIKIIPIATDGGGLRSSTNPKVSAGNRINCDPIPRSADLGLFRICLN